MQLLYRGVNNWDSIWTVLTFATSCLTISVYCINLIRELFQEDATVLWSQWQKLEDIAAESYFGAHGEKKTLAQTYQLPQEFTISKKDDILKLQNLQEKSIKKFKKLRFLLGDYGADAPYLVESFEYICPRLRCQELQLDFGYVTPLILPCDTLPPKLRLPVHLRLSRAGANRAFQKT